jgi:hypothetical protein
MWVREQERKEKQRKMCKRGNIPNKTNKDGNWLEAIVICNYKTMWLAHGSQVINHMTRSKRKKETCLVGGILHVQAHSQG